MPDDVHAALDARDDATDPEAGAPAYGASTAGGRRLSRRGLFAVAALGGLGAAGGAVLLRDGTASARPVGPASPLVGAAERGRTRSGRTVPLTLTAAPGTADLGGRQVPAWMYDGALPGKEVRVTRGDVLDLTLRNALPEATSIHWHGLSLRNDMDGTPGLTQDPVAPGTSFRYSFVVPDPGTYFFHPHSGLQLDQGLSAALVVEDPTEPAVADVEAVLLLDDWTTGVGPSPQAVYDALQATGTAGMAGGSGMAGMSGTGTGTGTGTGMGMATAAQPLGADGGDVSYPLHLVNGRPADDPYVVMARPGQRVRLRLVNAGADSFYRVAVGGHRLTVTHADGFPVEPVQVDTLILGMGERYDVVVTAGSGVFPIAVVREGKADAPARALLRTAPGTAPDMTARPAELDRRLLAYADLAPLGGTGLPPAAPAATYRYRLAAAPDGYAWTINDLAYDDRVPDTVRAGQRLRLEFTNLSSMFHPMHLHGHTFAMPGTGARKDTVNVAPMQTVAVDVQADNPGQWMIHCHNAYHLASGMATSLSYVA